ncbi:hypothetical protein [Bordetella petrii]|uniref:hypothetical protein n=1 Tax=Bordetella petrii TaxID=94624 RepID=UPI001E4C88CB|nr:hypothetical protein [Bordetella petrii]MCD0502089.1 hypothetical protein [Bordetella petrii]
MIYGFAPFVWMGLAALIVLIPGLYMLFGRGGPRDAAGRRMFRLRPVRRLCGCLLIALAGVSAMLALTLVQFLKLTTDVPVASVQIHEHAPGRFQLTTQVPGMEDRIYALAGDQWQIDAKVVRWRLPALLAGAPPLYAFERLSGRYSDIERERSEPRSAHALNDWPVPDLGTLKRVFPNWLPFVDVQFGSAAYMPMLDGARYRVYMDPRGAVVIRPDGQATEDALRQSGW